MIPHARTIRALMIAMIEAAFRTPAVAGSRGPDHRRHRSQRPGDRDGRFSGEAACPRRWSRGPLQLDVQRKPWHNRQDGLGVLEPEAVTRVRRFSPDPHPQPVQPTPSPRHDTNADEGMDGMENRTGRGFPPRPHPSVFFGNEERRTTQTA